MATFQCEIPAAEFEAIRASLQQRPMINNPDRRHAGEGRTQALGVIKRWAYRPWCSRITWMYPELWELIQAFAQKHITVPWTAVQVNQNYESKPHKDVGNCGDSSIVAFGDYEGGDLVVEGTPYDIRHRLHVFNGSERQHWNTPIIGSRYSLVFFNWVSPVWWDGGIPTVSTVKHGDQTWVRVDDIDGAIYELRGRKQITVRPPQTILPRVGKVQGKGGKALQVVPETSNPVDHSDE